MSQTKITENDEIYCESIANSISDIIRFSLNEEFRKSSFEMLGVVSTKQTEYEIKKRLMSMIENVGAKKRRKNISKKKDGPNEQQENKFSCQNETVKSEEVEVCCNPGKLPQNTQKNYLEISSEQFRGAVKRRKLQFYSQPEISHKHFELHNSSSQCSHSQPATSSMNEATTPEAHEINFCRNKFRECFKNNAQKYFKKNLKSRKSQSF